MKTLFLDFISRYKDVKKHFLKKEKCTEEELYKKLEVKCLEKMEVQFTTAAISSGKSDGLSKDEVLKLKEQT